MKTLEAMTKDERSLLLFMESCAVEKSGRVKAVHMNADDLKTAEQWNKEGFVKFGRIALEDISEFGSNWCRLSEEAWQLAFAERKDRANRIWDKRLWKTTAEKRKEEE